MSLGTALGFIALIFGAPRILVLRALGQPWLLDLAATILLFWMHWGTFSGVMVATFAAGMWSLCVRFARRWLGYINANRYHFGITDGRPTNA
jgi:hypothetical protein